MTKAKAISTIEYMLNRNTYNADQQEALEESIKALKQCDKPAMPTPILVDDWYSYERE